MGKGKRLNERPWHALDPAEIFRLLDTDPKSGLHETQAAERLQKYGPNELKIAGSKPAWLRFLLQFHQPLIYILIVASLVTAVLGEWVDSGVIIGIVIINAFVGFIQEARAENALNALARTLESFAEVIREGEKRQIPSHLLVPGDIVLLAAGDRVPADLRLFATRELQVDESALTGESIPVSKTVEPLPEETDLATRSNMAYASTLVTGGFATGVVVATGMNTEVGRISGLIASADDLQTPLTKKIAEFSRVLLFAILFLAAVTFLVGWLRGQPVIDVFMAAVALAVGAIPEGLPAAVTVVLSIGVARMAKRRAIIRRLPAVETLGSVTVICSDKTGTLTKNQMTVQAIIAGDARYEVSGTGYAPQGRIVRMDKPEDNPGSALLECLRAGLLCNDSRVYQKDGRWEIYGDPTEAALIVAAVKGGLDAKEEERRFPRIDTMPFDSKYQYMATLHEDLRTGRKIAYIKGAVEKIFQRCSKAMNQDGELLPFDIGVQLQNVERLTVRGLRVLAFAMIEFDADKIHIDHTDLEKGLVFLGIQGMIDPPRPEAITAVQICKKAGIEVKMITGDHPVTAAAIAEQIGIGCRKEGLPRVITGKELSEFNEDELRDLLEDVSVFARATPEQKIRIVRALQAKNHVVAMTGDGVNDAPALKQADIGVAMGLTGTDVAREAADMVLTDDNFSSIEAAVEEGRGVFDNLTKFIVWTLPTNLGEGLVLLVAILFGMTLPILPVQILWINMTTAGFLGLTLAFEPKEPGIMDRAPRNPEEPILNKILSLRILLVGALLLVGAFGLFELAMNQGATLEQARTVAVNAFIFMELFYLFNCRSLHHSIGSLGIFSNPWIFGGMITMTLVQLCYTYLPAMNTLFKSAPIPPDFWVGITGAGFATFLLVELEKHIRKRMKSS